MATRKRDIIQAIVNALKLIDGTTETLANSPRSPYTFTSNVNNNVLARQEYLDQLNDFPVICCYPVSSETRTRIGAAETYCSFLLEIRGYVHGEDPIMLSSDLAQDIQYIIDSMKYRDSTLNLIECRTESLSTDEGLLEPYGVAEVRALIVYLQDSNI